MKKISIKYNPYLITTQILIDGKEQRSNSSLQFEKQRLQEWADKLPDLLVTECKDKNFQIEFTGTSTDFEDLKLAFALRKESIDCDFTHQPTLEIAEVEAKVDQIFKTIQDINSPAEELRDPAIMAAFTKAKNQEFEVNVIATMSSGKSTLINALLGKQLMPARNEATTATVVKIIDTDQPEYSLKAYDSEGNHLAEFDLGNATPEQIDTLNDDPNVSVMEIRGRIPFVPTVGMQLVLVDTPGPNNARNINHQKLTYEMLENSDKSLVLYVLNGEALGINDNENLLDYVCKCMKEGGKQSRDRYLFAVNKMDVFKLKEANRIEGILKHELENLESRGIFNPCLFPISSLAALELRTNEVDIQALNTFRTRSNESTCYHFDNYYAFNRLPLVVKNRLQTLLDKNNPDQTVEIHTGVVSIEQAIALYINKYARPSKIMDLVDSFNNKLNDLATMENIQKAIREDNAKKEKIEKQIDQIKTNLSAAKEAKSRTKVIESLDFTKGVKEAIQGCVKEVQSNINTIISSNKGASVELNEAKRACKKINESFNSNTAQLQVKVEQILKKSYEESIHQLLDEYKKYLEQLNVHTNSKDFHINPTDLISSDLSKLINADTLIDRYKKAPIDEGKFVTVYKKQKVEGNRGKSALVGGVGGALIGGLAFAADMLGGCGVFTALAAGAGIGLLGGAATGDDDKEVDVPEKKWESKMVTYVNMADVVINYFMPRQKVLATLPDKVVEYVATETKKMKKALHAQLVEIDKLVETKLDELTKSQNANEQTAEEIRKKTEKLEWLEGIQSQINNLINF